MKKRLLLTHYDLDGIGSDILLSGMFPIAKKYHYGYQKVKGVIDNTNLLKQFDSIMVPDLCLTYEQFKKLNEIYQDRFLYVDHHLASMNLYTTLWASDNKPTMYIDTSMCATALVYTKMRKYLGDMNEETSNNIKRLVTYVDSYDMWRHKTHPDTFDKGYNLNTIFFEYGYNKFFDKFKYGIRDFDKEDVKIINIINKNRNDLMAKSEFFPFGNKSVFVLGVNVKYVNDYSLVYHDYDNFYLVYATDGGVKMSVRSTRDDVDFGQAIITLKEGITQITSGGGHKQSASIQFTKDTTVNDMSYFAEKLEDYINGNKAE